MLKQNKKRKLNRLKNYDYSKSGFYFVTICIKNKESLFGEVLKEKMLLNDYGKIVEKEILNTEKNKKRNKN